MLSKLIGSLLVILLGVHVGTPAAKGASHRSFEQMLRYQAPWPPPLIVGLKPDEVRRKLGEPDAILRNGTWVYGPVVAGHPVETWSGVACTHGTVLVGFEEGRAYKAVFGYRTCDTSKVAYTFLGDFAVPKGAIDSRRPPLNWSSPFWIRNLQWDAGDIRWAMGTVYPARSGPHGGINLSPPKPGAYRVEQVVQLKIKTTAIGKVPSSPPEKPSVGLQDVEGSRRAIDISIASLPIPYRSDIPALLDYLENASRSQPRKQGEKDIRDFSRVAGWLPKAGVVVRVAGTPPDDGQIPREKCEASIAENAGEPYGTLEHLGRLWEGRGGVGMDEVRFRTGAQGISVTFGPYVLSFEIEDGKAVLAGLAGGYADEGD
jgi:hypothetical protein